MRALSWSTGWRYLLPSLTIWGQYPWHTYWKERCSSSKLVVYLHVCVWLWHMNTHTGECTDILTKVYTDKWVKWKYNYKTKEKKAMVIGYILGFPILGLSPKNLRFSLIDTYSAMSIGSLFTITRKWKQHKCTPTDKQMMKMLYIYTIEYHLYAK